MAAIKIPSITNKRIGQSLQNTQQQSQCPQYGQNLIGDVALEFFVLHILSFLNAKNAHEST